jgi:hypothetical protein
MIRRLVVLWERYPAEALRGRMVFL